MDPGRSRAHLGLRVVLNDAIPVLPGRTIMLLIALVIPLTLFMLLLFTVPLRTQLAPYIGEGVSIILAFGVPIAILAAALGMIFAVANWSKPLVSARNLKFLVLGVVSLVSLFFSCIGFQLFQNKAPNFEIPWLFNFGFNLGEASAPLHIVPMSTLLIPGVWLLLWVVIFSLSTQQDNEESGRTCDLN